MAVRAMDDGEAGWRELVELLGRGGWAVLLGRVGLVGVWGSALALGLPGFLLSCPPKSPTGIILARPPPQFRCHQGEP